MFTPNTVSILKFHVLFVFSGVNIPCEKTFLILHYYGFYVTCPKLMMHPLFPFYFLVQSRILGFAIPELFGKYVFNSL